MSKYISLWLSGPMQAWGSSSRSDIRPTNNLPTLSGIVGMLRAAQGIKNGEGSFLFIKSMDCYSFSENGKSIKMLTDYQNVGADYSDKFKGFRTTSQKGYGKGGNRQTYRDYLLGAKFGVVIEVDDSFDSNCIISPVFPMCLGRKCCIPDDVIFITESNIKSDVESEMFKKSNDLTCIISQFQVNDNVFSDETGVVSEIRDLPISKNVYTTRKIRTVYAEETNSF